MEVKKSPKADLQNKKGLFLQIGLVVALLITIGLFWYSQPEKKVQEIDMGLAFVEEEITEITTQDQKPPEPPRQQTMVVADVLNIVQNDVQVSTSLDFSDFNEDEVVVATAAVQEEASTADEFFFKVESMPSFQGGDLNTFRNWVQGRLRYPPVAAENGISGRVTLQFIVERDGTLTNIVVMQTPDRSLSEEAERVLKTSPKWTPGKQGNRPVRVKYTLPVDFRIQS